MKVLRVHTQNRKGKPRRTRFRSGTPAIGKRRSSRWTKNTGLISSRRKPSSLESGRAARLLMTRRLELTTSHGYSQIQSDNAGRRGATVSDFAELTPGAKPREVAAAPEDTNERPQQPGQDHVAASRRRPQAPLPADRFPPQQGRRAGQGRFDPIRSEPLGPHRAVALRRRREAIHRRPARLEGRRHGDERRRCTADGRQLLAADEDSAGHGDSQHRAAGWPRRRAVPQCRHERDAHGPRGGLGADLAAQRRNSPYSVGLPGDDRRRPAIRIAWQSCGARRAAIAGWAAGRTFAAPR